MLISVSICFYFEEKDSLRTGSCLERRSGRTDRSGGSGLPVRMDALSIILRLSVDTSERSAVERADWLCNMMPAVSHLKLHLLTEGVACHCDAFMGQKLLMLLK